MAIESERPALSMESIPKSISGIQMEQSTAEASNSENPEPPERRMLKVRSEKNGNLDFYSIEAQCM